MKNKILEIRGWIYFKLRLWCGKMVIEYRLITILVMITLLGAGSIYMFVSSIYNLGKQDATNERLQIEHIRQFELNSDLDSVPLKDEIYGFPDSPDDENVSNANK